MLKRMIAVAMVAAMTAICGCGTGCVVKDGPVAPEFQSNERSSNGDPSLPYMKPWWRD